MSPSEVYDELAPAPARPPIRVRCRQGGLAPCFDDLCHGVDTTMCGLEYSYDFCGHGYLPSTCDEGCAEDGLDDVR